MKQTILFFEQCFDWLINGTTRKNLQYDIIFGREAAHHGQHGQVVGTWLKEGAKTPINIPFFIKGYTPALPPKLDHRLMEEMYHHAEMNGIIISHLYSYAAITPAVKQS